MCEICISIDTVADATENLYSNIDQVDQNGSPDHELMTVFDPKIPEICPVPVEEFGQFVYMNHRELNQGYRELFKV